jgi:hypothetical protein
MTTKTLPADLAEIIARRPTRLNIPCDVEHAPNVRAAAALFDDILKTLAADHERLELAELELAAVEKAVLPADVKGVRVRAARRDVTAARGQIASRLNVVDRRARGIAKAISEAREARASGPARRALLAETRPQKLLELHEAAARFREIALEISNLDRLATEQVFAELRSHGTLGVPAPIRARPERIGRGVDQLLDQAVAAMQPWPAELARVAQLVAAGHRDYPLENFEFENFEVPAETARVIGVRRLGRKTPTETETPAPTETRRTTRARTVTTP